MRRGRVFILLAIIIIIGLVAVYLVQRNFFPLGTSSSGTTTVEESSGSAPSAQMVDIIVVAQDVPRGTVLNEEHLTTMEWPQENFWRRCLELTREVQCWAVKPDMILIMEPR